MLFSKLMRIWNSSVTAAGINPINTNMPLASYKAIPTTRKSQKQCSLFGHISSWNTTGVVLVRRKGKMGYLVVTVSAIVCNSSDSTERWGENED